MDPKSGLVRYSFNLCSKNVHEFHLYTSKFGSKVFFKWVGAHAAPLGILFDDWRWCLQVPSPHCWQFQLKPQTLRLGSLSPWRSLGLYKGFPHSHLRQPHTSIHSPGLLALSLVSTQTISCPPIPSPPLSHTIPSLYLPPMTMVFPLLCGFNNPQLGIPSGLTFKGLWHGYSGLFFFSVQCAIYCFLFNTYKALNFF